MMSPGPRRSRPSGWRRLRPQGAGAAVGFALLAVVTLAGVPENLALGVSLLSGGGSLALLTLAVVFGRGVFAQFPEEHLAFPLAFAGGAVLVSLADTLMPEAFELGRPLNSMATAGGFFVSFALSG